MGIANSRTSSCVKFIADHLRIHGMLKICFVFVQVGSSRSETHQSLFSTERDGTPAGS